MVQRFGREPVVLGEAIRGVRRVGKHPAALAQHLRVEVDQRSPQPHILIVVREVTVLGAAQLVRGAVLMNQPRNLVGVTHEIRRELRADHEVDGLAVRLTQIDQPPCSRMRQNLTLRIPLEGDADAL